MERDRHHHAQDQVLDVLAAAGQQLAQTPATAARTTSLTLLGLVGVGDLLGDLQAAADDGQPAFRYDRAVEAGAGSALGEARATPPTESRPAAGR